MSARPLSIAQLERFVDARELARVMGVSTSTIKRWTRAGMPSETWGIRTRRFQPSRAIAWVQEREAADRAIVDGGRGRAHNAPRETSESEE